MDSKAIVSRPTDKPPRSKAPSPLIHPTSVIHPRASIGQDCEIGPYCVIGEHVTLGSGCRLLSHVVNDGHTKLGEGNTIYPFASIGLRTQDLRWNGGCAKVVQDVPPYMLADGNPAETRTINKVGLARHGVPEKVQTALKQAFKLVFRDGLTTSRALAKIKAGLPMSEEMKHFVEFIRTSERGIVK